MRTARLLCPALLALLALSACAGKEAAPTSDTRARAQTETETGSEGGTVAEDVLEAYVLEYPRVAVRGPDSVSCEEYGGARTELPKFSAYDCLIDFGYDARETWCVAAPVGVPQSKAVIKMFTSRGCYAYFENVYQYLDD